MNGDWNVMIWAIIPIIAVSGGIVSAIIAIVNKSRIRELEIRERIAMIERGLVPPPEVDPHGFDRAMDRLERAQLAGSLIVGTRPSRHRRSGIILMGVGFGLMILIGFSERSGDVRDALGVGGFLVIVGLAFLISSYIESGASQPLGGRPTAATPPAPPPSTPPQQS